MPLKYVKLYVKFHCTIFIKNIPNTIISSEMIAAGKEFSFVYKTLSVMYRDRNYLGFNGLNQVQNIDNRQHRLARPSV